MIKVAVIGTGAIAPYHIRAYMNLPEYYQIVALCDMYVDKAEHMAKEYQLDVPTYQDVTQMLQEVECDLVSVCTPPYTHASLAIQCMEAGRHVIVEKPMASSLEECDAMNLVSKKTNKILSVIAQNRFGTPMMKVKHILDTGLIGKVVHTQVDSFWWRGHSYYDLWWRGTWEKEGGGCTLNHAVHHIDIFQWMNGMPDEVVAIMSNTSHDNAEVEDISIAVCKYNNGSVAQITSSVIHHGQEQQLIFQGQQARVSVPWKVSASSARPNGFPEQNMDLEAALQELYEQQSDLDYEGHLGQLHDVALAINGVKDVLVDGVEGRKTLELITAIYQSASLGTNVKLPLTEESPFYRREGVLSQATHFYEKSTSVTNFESNKITT